MSLRPCPTPHPTDEFIPKACEAVNDVYVGAVLLTLAGLSSDADKFEENIICELSTVHPGGNQVPADDALWFVPGNDCGVTVYVPFVLKKNPILAEAVLPGGNGQSHWHMHIYLYH